MHVNFTSSSVVMVTTGAVLSVALIDMTNGCMAAMFPAVSLTFK